MYSNITRAVPSTTLDRFVRCNMKSTKRAQNYAYVHCLKFFVDFVFLTFSIFKRFCSRQKKGRPTSCILKKKMNQYI